MRELRVVFSSAEPDISEDGAVVVNTKYVTPTSIYGEYTNWGGKKTMSEFYAGLFNIIK